MAKASSPKASSSPTALSSPKSIQVAHSSTRATIDDIEIFDGGKKEDKQQSAMSDKFISEYTNSLRKLQPRAFLELHKKNKASINEFFLMSLTTSGVISTTYVLMNPLMIVACLNIEKDNQSKHNMMKLLVKNGADMRAGDESRKASLLVVACEYADADTIKMILDLYKEKIPGSESDKRRELANYINTPTENDCTAVHAAAKIPHKGVLKLLVENGGDLDKSDSIGRTPESCVKVHSTKAELAKLREQYIQSLTPTSAESKGRVAAFEVKADNSHATAVRKSRNCGPCVIL
jgi:hypothetical protein